MKKQQNGQAMVIMAFALIVLLGMLALSIDGGRAFTERRKAQNTADDATMAGVRELGSGASSVTAERATYEAALDGGYTLLPEHISTNSIPVVYGSYDTGLTGSYRISVTVDSGIEGMFSQFVYDSFLDVNAYSEMEVVLAHPPFAGFGIVTLGASCGHTSAVGTNGGGNSGGISLYGSSILVNSEDDNCAFSPPTSTNNDGIFACSTYYPVPISPAYNTPLEACLGAGGQPIDMFAVGSYNDGNNENLGNVDDNFNDGESLDDPLADLPEPICTVDHRNDPTTTSFTQGIWNDNQLGAGVYEAGIYCIQGSNGNGFKVTQDTVDASSGVLFYFQNGADLFNVTGQGSIDLRAAGNGTYTGCPLIPERLSNEDTQTARDARKKVCNYRGLGIYVEHGMEAEITLGGNGSYLIYGTIYGDTATLSASGGGSSTSETIVYGQLLVGDVNNSGGGSLQVFYNEVFSYIVPPVINALD